MALDFNSVNQVVITLISTGGLRRLSKICQFEIIRRIIGPVKPVTALLNVLAIKKYLKKYLSPLLNLQTVQAPFLGNPTLYIGFLVKRGVHTMKLSLF